MSRASRILPSAVDAIGNTPLVDLSRIVETDRLEGRILAKLEYLNPGASKKDRIAKQILEEAEALGTLKPGQAVVELTSGNAGTGAAIVCAIQKRPFIAVMSSGNSSERARMMRALGAEVILVPQAPGSLPGRVSGDDLALVDEMAAQIEQERGAFRIDQFARSGNWRAHALHTANEIWEASGGITAFCDFVGSGGTFAGLWRTFKGHDPTVRGYVVEPLGGAVLSGGEISDANHQIQGGGYAMPSLAQLAGVKPDGFVSVSDEEAIHAARRLAREEGIFGGFSSGANLAAALRLLADRENRGTIAIVIADSGLKYLSTELWPA